MAESTNDIKQKAIKGMLWSFIERFGSLLILFVSNIALARMLSPDEFGIVGILMAFLAAALCGVVIKNLEARKA